ncbi:MAG: 2-oxo acid dehydrogenase subunit E2 [Oligoflexia bacterium]|nr:2-oxo acid dehydrogenase subunit E2 [Oligoflexia bacterium]
MALFQKNLQLGKPLKLSAFRKVAIGTWRTAHDPSVYSILELDVGPALNYLQRIQAKTGTKVTLTHFTGKAAAETIRRHPELNCILRFGQLYPRQSVDIFFQVASDTKGSDLSGTTIRHADRKAIADIAREMQESVSAIRTQGDPAYKKMKKTMKGLPGFLSAWMIDFSAFLQYTLNIWSPLFGIPRDAFGSLMVTNIGSLDLDMAFAPLVPYSRVPCLLAVGAVRDTPVVRDGQLAVAPVSKICVTFDHRLIDGIHASHMSKTVKKIFANPEAELGPV